MRQFIYLILSISMLLGRMSVAKAANSYGLPEKIQDSNILHCFDWTFNDIKNELPAIAEAGFGAIQVSPVQGNALSNAEWFYAYMPYDFAFKANGNGTRQQLKTLCEEAEKYGIKIIVDVVANHINQASNYHDSWWDSNGRIRWEGNVKYDNRYSITHGQLGEYGDVNSEDAQVQARAVAFLEDLKSLGVKGIRWDAAKHIGLPSESCNFWSKMAAVAGLWQYGEILDGPGGNKYNLLKEYTKYIGVTDTEYSQWTRRQVNSGQVPTGGGSWSVNGVASNKIVLWAESHDDYSNNGQYGENTSSMPQDRMDRAYAITACRNNETALYFSRPAKTSRNEIRMGQKGSTHFKSKEIAEVNKFRNAMVGKADYYTQSNGVACITRKGGGAVIVVGAGGSRNVNVGNGGSYVPAGTYTDKISGNKFTVTSSSISGSTGSTGIAVIYGDVIVDDPIGDDPIGDNDYYVYLNNTNNWSEPTVWAWNTNENCTFSGAWPGDKMTRQSDGIWLWKAPAGKIPTQIIFSEFSNADGTKTADLEYRNHATYKCDGSLAGNIDIPIVPGKENTVYFNNSSNWEQPYVWAWNTYDNCTVSGAWPGDKMTKLSNGNWSWSAPEGKQPEFIIFNPGGDNGKTADLIFVANATYNPDGTYIENPVTGVVIENDIDDIPRYFSLDGIEVNNPKQGLYIVIKSGKASKVLIK